MVLEQCASQIWSWSIFDLEYSSRLLKNIKKVCVLQNPDKDPSLWQNKAMKIWEFQKSCCPPDSIAKCNTTFDNCYSNLSVLQFLLHKQSFLLCAALQNATNFRDCNSNPKVFSQFCYIKKRMKIKHCCTQWDFRQDSDLWCHIQSVGETSML